MDGWVASVSDERSYFRSPDESEVEWERECGDQMMSTPGQSIMCLFVWQMDNRQHVCADKCPWR